MGKVHFVAKTALRELLVPLLAFFIPVLLIKPCSYEPLRFRGGLVLNW
jgi:hypothetical protein